MKASTRIAWRYLRPGKRSGLKSQWGAIQLIQSVSIAGVGVGAAALVLVLSAFNGLEDLVRSFYDRFDPDFKVLPAEGKTFAIGLQSLRELRAIKGLQSLAQVAEDKVLLKHGDFELIGVFKGVDTAYSRVNALGDCLVAGSSEPGFEQAGVIGIGLAYRLGYHPQETEAGLTLFVPKRGMPEAGNWLDSYRSMRFAPKAIFSVQPEFDDVYAIGSIEMARELFEIEPDRVSALEIDIAPGADGGEIERKIRGILGDNVEIFDRDQQQSTVFKVLKSEGMLTYLILAFTLAIACFTIFGTLSMAMLEKKTDLFTLWTLGMERSELKRLFFLRGMQISMMGGLYGMAGGSVLVWLQDRYHLVRLGSGYAVDAYPVRLSLDDLLLVVATLALLGGLVSWLGSRGIPRFGQTAIRRLD